MTQFFYLLRWNYLRQKDLFLLFTLAQVLLSISLLFGYPLVIGEIDTTAAYYLSSGSVLIGIISIGCTISSPVIANAKSEGHVDYVRALPIPRILISLVRSLDVDDCYFTWSIHFCYTGLFSFFCPTKCICSGCFHPISDLSYDDQSWICNCLYFFSQYCHADVSVDSHDWFDVFTNHVPCKSSSRLDKPSLPLFSICPFCQPLTSLCL